MAHWQRQTLVVSPKMDGAPFAAYAPLGTKSGCMRAVLDDPISVPVERLGAT